jgi:ubiquinone/menaquinone biosynthesis C-methylase UbiE
MNKTTYAPPTVWDGYYTTKADHNDDLNPNGMWAQAWLPLLAPYTLNRVLDLGCGTGGDALVLARHRYQVTGLDYSQAALHRAQAKAEAEGLSIRFIQGDMAARLPFEDAHFDVVMSNVALHMFDDATTRQIVGEVKRVVRPNGLLCLHLNSTEDMPYRALRYRQVEELEPNYWREAHGQTMHFFDEPYLRSVLAEWTLLHLEHLPLRDVNTGDIFKCVWRCIAQNVPK